MPEKSADRKDRKDRKEKHPCRSRSPSSDREYCFEDLYNYYKYKLLTDSQLMVAGSNAYATASSIVSNVIPQLYPVNMEVNHKNENVDHLSFGAPFHVRKAGVYQLIAVLNSDNACQITVYVNGVDVELTRVGNNAGAGQLRIQALLSLNVDDGIVIRNNTSSAATVISTVNDGGIQTGNPATILLFRLSVPPSDLLQDTCQEIEHHDRKLFKKLKNKLIADPDCMLKGYNIHGSFFTFLDQTINVNSDLLWDNYTQVAGLTWDPLFPERVTVTVDGVYKVVALLNVVRPSQITLCINGVPVENTTQGIDRGAAQLSTRTLFDLKAGDYITVRNYTSANGAINLVENAGGLLQAIAAILIIFKVAPPLKCAPVKPEVCLKDEEYKEFRAYLAECDDLTIQGLTTYISLTSDTNLTIDQEPVPFNIQSLVNRFKFTPGFAQITVQQTGTYFVLFDVLTAQPNQFTLFVNNTPDLLTTSGRNSGGSRSTLMQLVYLNQGDVIELRSFQSATPVQVSLNAGGIEHANNRKFQIILIAPKAPKDCPHKSMSCKSQPRILPKNPAKEYIFA